MIVNINCRIKLSREEEADIGCHSRLSYRLNTDGFRTFNNSSSPLLSLPALH